MHWRDSAPLLAPLRVLFGSWSTWASPLMLASALPIAPPDGADGPHVGRAYRRRQSCPTGECFGGGVWSSLSWQKRVTGHLMKRAEVLANFQPLLGALSQAKLLRWFGCLARARRACLRAHRFKRAACCWSPIGGVARGPLRYCPNPQRTYFFANTEAPETWVFQ